MLLVTLLGGNVAAVVASAVTGLIGNGAETDVTGT
jgi:hypothetical protein